MKTISEIYEEAEKVSREILDKPSNDDMLWVAREMIRSEVERYDRYQRKEK